MTTSIERKKADRFRFLNAAYDATEGKSPRFFSVWKIGESLGLTREETRSIFEYLSGEYLIEPKFAGGGYLLLHAGLVEVEEALSNPNHETQHFPPISMVYNTGTMINQNVHGDGNVVATTQTVTISDVGVWIDLLEDLKRQVTDIASEVETQTLLLRRIDEIMEELKKPTPDNSKVKKLLQGIRSLLSFVGSAVAEGWIQKLLGLN